MAAALFCASSAPRRLLRSLAEGWLIPSTPVTPDEIAAGYRAPASGAAGIVPAPEGAVTNARWRLRGAHDDAFRPELADWRFPVLDGVVTGVTVLARGEVRPDVGTLYFPASPVDGVSLLPESRQDGAASLFWHALSPSNSLLLTWENALVGRDPNCPTNLQAELYADGRFAWRTDGGSRLYLPVLDFDWDGDGLENSVDPDPLVAGPDAHGTNAEWCKVVCTNVFTGATGSEPDDSDAPRLLPEGVEFRENVTSNAYYFVDVVAEQGPAPIYFMAGQRSDLGSPVLVAIPGVTNRVPLQIGIEYAVTSAVPFSVGLPMSGFAELHQDEPTRKTIKWPLEFVFTEELGRNGVRTYSVGVAPYNPGGRFSWETEDGPHGRASLMSSDPSMPECGCVSTANGVVTFCCSGSCSCGGTCEASGSYYVAGSIFGVTGGVCRCGFDDPGEDEPPPPPEINPSGVSVSVSFTRSAVIFEDPYENEPAKLVPRTSKRIRLDIYANGGPNGGTLSFESTNLEKLVQPGGTPISLPGTMNLTPNEEYQTSYICEGCIASGGADDVSVFAYATDNESSQVSSDTASMTSVQITLEPKISVGGRTNRHKWGAGEEIMCKWTPHLSNITVTPCNGFPEIASYAGRIDYKCPYTDVTHLLYVDVGDTHYSPSTQVITPTSVEARDGEVMRFGVPAGTPGGAGFSMYMYVLPDTVAFQGVDFVEVPSVDGEIEGYFRDPEFEEFWYHTSRRGAGWWRRVQGDNLWFQDVASMGDRLKKPCSTGRIVWEIPIAWRAHDGDGSRRQIMTVNQTFRMTPSGTLKVEKYQYWVERALNGDMRWASGMR